MCGASASLANGRSGNWNGIERLLLASQQPTNDAAPLRLRNSSQRLAISAPQALERCVAATSGKRGNTMGKFFENLGMVLIAGLVLAILIAVLPDSGYRPPADLLNGVLQWLHVF